MGTLWTTVDEASRGHADERKRRAPRPPRRRRGAVSRRGEGSISPGVTGEVVVFQLDTRASARAHHPPVDNAPAAVGDLVADGETRSSRGSGCPAKNAASNVGGRTSKHKCQKKPGRRRPPPGRKPCRKRQRDVDALTHGGRTRRTTTSTRLPSLGPPLVHEQDRPFPRGCARREYRLPQRREGLRVARLEGEGRPGCGRPAGSSQTTRSGGAGYRRHCRCQ